MENKTRYIVVVFRNNVGYTYQTDGGIRWFFSNNALGYIKLAYAKKRAEDLGKVFPNHLVCVFKCELTEELSCDKYHDWYKDNDRLMFKFRYTNY